MFAIVGFMPEGGIGHISLHANSRNLLKYVHSKAIAVRFKEYFGNNIFVYEGVGGWLAKAGQFPDNPVADFSTLEYGNFNGEVLWEWMNKRRGEW